MLEEIRQLEMPAMKCLLSRPHVQVAGGCPADASAAAEGAGLRVQGCEQRRGPSVSQQVGQEQNQPVLKPPQGSSGMSHWDNLMFLSDVCF